MEDFVRPGSIVRRIWSDADCVLFVFAGSAAEFALSRAVDWLFVTGRLPSDPIGRFFSTAAYAQRIVLGDATEAGCAIDEIRRAHQAVERLRGERIPDWAHRDVLYMLVDYSARAFERLHRPLRPVEREGMYATFRRFGEALEIPGLPADYEAWEQDRSRSLERHLEYSPLTRRLYAAYRRQLGTWRYLLLLQLQAAIVPEHVSRLLGLAPAALAAPLLPVYAGLRRTPARTLVHRALIPPEHLAAVSRLDRPAAG
ncbi:MAG: oxygenase MpaB family protein [Pseudomonadota bacterium]|jgi:uncharacterized protein (DUF2236 family)|nr:MAG: DUF2236 domain-containing protein [Pseudomonadota bacterium]